MPALRDGLTNAWFRERWSSAMRSTSPWRADGLSGQATSADGPVSVTFDNSPPSGTPVFCLPFSKETRLAKPPIYLRRNAARSCSIAWSGCSDQKPRTRSGSWTRRWAADEFARGCYGGYLPPGAWLMYGEGPQRPRSVRSTGPVPRPRRSMPATCGWSDQLRNPGRPRDNRRNLKRGTDLP